MDFKPFKIGKYLLLERLATGGMAEVYRAKASGAGGFEKQLAVKRILPTYSTNEEFRRMFEYEARLSSMLTHANIVQIYDFVKSGDTYLLAMEYVDGKNLRQFINKAKKVNVVPSVEFAVYVINEVCKGLEYAHKKKDDLNGRPLNIIHRDMSPQNIMLSYEGAVKIVDFGIAKAKDRVDETRSGVIKGKFGYMSPEQANGEPVDHRTDIFSTGIILFELLTGRRLFSAENDMATLKLIQGCVIPQPARINPKISSELEKILLRSLTKDLALRYQSAGAFHRSLQEYLNKYYPSYTQKEATDTLQKVFAEEIENEKRRFEQIYRQSIPFSQGDSQKNQEDEFGEIEDILDGEITKSEAGDNTAVTFTAVDEEAPSDGDGDVSPNEATSVEGAMGGATRVEDVSGAGELPDEEEFSQETKAEAVEPPSVTAVPSGRPARQAEPSLKTLADPQGGRRAPTPGARSKAATLVEPEDPTPTPEPSTPDEPSEKMPMLSEGVDEEAETNVDVAAPVGREKRAQTVTPTPTPTQAASRPATTTRRNEPQPTEAEVSLRTQDYAVPTRRRERNTGFHELGGPNQDGRIKLDVDHAVSRRGRYYPEQEDYLPQAPPRHRTVLSFVVFVGLLAGTVYLYNLYLNNEMHWIIELFFPKRSTTAVTSSVDTAGPETVVSNPKPETNECAVEVDSDPVGAQVIVDGVLKGVTSTIFSAPCNRSIDLTIKLDGYETISENLVVKERNLKRYKSLKKIPMGAIELSVNRNAKIYVDGVFRGEVNPLEKFSLPLRAKKKYTVRFVNEIFGIDVTKELYVEENEVTRRTIELEEPQPSLKHRRR